MLSPGIVVTEGPLNVLDLFPPGRRRAMVMHLAGHREYDEPGWCGDVIFRCYRTDKAGKAGVAVKVEPAEESIL